MITPETLAVFTAVDARAMTARQSTDLLIRVLCEIENDASSGYQVSLYSFGSENLGSEIDKVMHILSARGFCVSKSQSFNITPEIIINWK